VPAARQPAAQSQRRSALCSQQKRGQRKYDSDPCRAVQTVKDMSKQGDARAFGSALSPILSSLGSRAKKALQLF
jgi:hypothetical protein